MTGPDDTSSLGSLYYYQTQCNLNCHHCWLGPGLSKPKGDNGATMSPDLFEDILKQGVALGLKHIKFTGGEPLCDSGLMRKVEAARAMNLEVSIETNATLITEVIARDIKRLGVRFIALSLDGADPESHNYQRGNRTAFIDTMAGLQALVNEGIRPQVIYTPTRDVLSRTKEIVMLLNQFPVSSLKINIVSMIGRGKAIHNKGDVPSIEEYLKLKTMIESSEIVGRSYSIILDIPPAFRSMGRIMRKSHGRCGIKNILGILSDGRISICGVGLVNDELVLGDLKTDRLEDIWQNHAILHTLRTGLPNQLQGICGDCVLKRMCLGKCRAEAFVAEGDLMAASRFCRHAEEQGLFPSTRQISKIKGTRKQASIN